MDFGLNKEVKVTKTGMLGGVLGLGLGIGLLIIIEKVIGTWVLTAPAVLILGLGLIYFGLRPDKPSSSPDETPLPAKEDSPN